MKRLEELKNEQNTEHQKNVLDQVIVYDGVEMTVGFVIYHLELIIRELNEQNKAACDKVVELAQRVEQHGRLLKLMKDVLDDSKRVNI